MTSTPMTAPIPTVEDLAVSYGRVEAVRGVSFEVAGKWMSADVINVSAAGSSVGKGESLRDTALTLRAAGADALIIRHPASGAAHLLADWTAEPDPDRPEIPMKQVNPMKLPGKLEKRR